MSESVVSPVIAQRRSVSLRDSNTRMSNISSTPQIQRILHPPLNSSTPAINPNHHQSQGSQSSVRRPNQSQEGDLKRRIRSTRAVAMSQESPQANESEPSPVPVRQNQRRNLQPPQPQRAARQPEVAAANPHLSAVQRALAGNMSRREARRQNELLLNTLLRNMVEDLEENN